MNPRLLDNISIIRIAHGNLRLKIMIKVHEIRIKQSFGWIRSKEKWSILITHLFFLNILVPIIWEIISSIVMLAKFKQKQI